MSCLPASNFHTSPSGPASAKIECYRRTSAGPRGGCSRSPLAALMQMLTRDRPLAETIPLLGTQTEPDFRREWPLENPLGAVPDQRSSVRSQKSTGLSAVPYRKDVIARGMSTPTNPTRSPLQSHLTLPARATSKPLSRTRPIKSRLCPETTAGWQRVNRSPWRVVTGYSY